MMIEDQGPPPDFDEGAEPTSTPPPHDIEAEAAILSASLLDGQALEVASTLVQPEDFYSEAHRQIFAAALAVRLAGKPVDIVTCGTWLKDHGRIDQVGGLGYLTEVLNAAPAIRNVGAYAETVRRKSIERKGIAMLSLAAAEARTANGQSLILYARVASELTTLTSSAPRQARFEILTGKDMAIDEPPLTYLVEALGLVDGAGPPHMVAGAGYSGKTMICQELLLSLSSARHAWGAFEVGPPRRVLHVDLEQGRKLTKLRYKRLALARNIDLVELGDALGATCFPRGLRLVADQWRTWRDLMSDRDVILIDSQRVASAGLDENSSEFRESLDMLGGLSAETSCRPFVIHHLRKESKDGGAMLQELIRGSSAIFEALDCCLLLKKRDGEDVTVHQVKARSHGEIADPFSVTVSDVAGPVGERKWGLRISVAGMERVEEQRRAAEEVAREKEARSIATKIRAALAAHPDQTAEELAHRVRMRKHAIIGALLDMSVVQSTRESEGGRPAKVYRLP